MALSLQRAARTPLRRERPDASPAGPAPACSCRSRSFQAPRGSGLLPTEELVREDRRLGPTLEADLGQQAQRRRPSPSSPPVTSRRRCVPWSCIRNELEGGALLRRQRGDLLSVPARVLCGSEILFDRGSRSRGHVSEPAAALGWRDACAGHQAAPALAASPAGAARPPHRPTGGGRRRMAAAGPRRGTGWVRQDHASGAVAGGGRGVAAQSGVVGSRPGRRRPPTVSDPSRGRDPDRRTRGRCRRAGPAGGRWHHADRRRPGQPDQRSRRPRRSDGGGARRLPRDRGSRRP